MRIAVVQLAYGDEESFEQRVERVAGHALPVWPLHTLSTTTLTEQGDNTTLLTLVWSAFEATAEETAAFDAAHASMNQGWSGNLDVLEDYLSVLQTA